MPSCDTPLWQAAESTVVTVEGLAADGPNPVQQSLIDHQAAQCGFCISGIVVRATALLEETPDASAEQVAVGPRAATCADAAPSSGSCEAVLAAKGVPA